MKKLISSLTALWLLAAPAAQADESVMSKEAITALIEQHFTLQNAMFGKNSSVDAVNALFALYTEDFIYNHPGQGDIYSRALLYKNSVRNAENGSFNGSFAKKHTATIIGKNAATIEWKWVEPGREPDPTKHMTLIEFKNGKIAMMKEYW